MKKVLALMLALAMVFAFAACDNAQAPADGGNEGGNANATVGGSIVVGSTTDLDANMLSGWTNGSQNAAIRTLIFGYGTVAYTKDGQFIADPTVTESIEGVMNDDGTKTFTVKLQKDLVYNDGSAITAKDYVFSILFGSSPEFGALEADNTSGYSFVGFDAFNAGETKTFSGVKLIDDYTFSVTVIAEELPFHYDLNFAGVSPLPMAVVAPGVELTDDGNGATLSDAFTTDLLATTVNANEGYRYMPKVTCGPYQLESYDDSTKIAVLTINDKFKGNYEGVTPKVEKITLKSVISGTEMDELAAGNVDLISGVSGGDSINAGLDVVDEGKAVAYNYDRAGYGKICFSCDFGPTQFAAVRQAIAHCLDRDEFAKQYSGGYAKVVNGYYGLSTPEYKNNKEIIDSTLNNYAKDLEKAKELLIADGWTLNKDGGEFVEGTDEVRYKNVDGELMALEINWANTPNNPVSDLLNTMLPSEMAKVGMKLNPTTVEFGVLLNEMYRQGIEAPTYHMFNLATGFATQTAVWYYYSDDPMFLGMYNTNFITDEELCTLAKEMKAIPLENVEEWEAAWVKFQTRWNYLLPDIPLYSDNYHDFANPKLKGYEPDSLWQWDSAILYCWVEE